MHKIEELEKKWYHYKIKVVMIPLISSIITACIGSGGYYVYYKYTKRTPITKDTNLSSPKMVMAKVEKRVTTNENSLRDISLEPIIPVIDMEKEEAIKYAQKKAYHKKRTYRQTRQTSLVKAKPNNYLTAKELAHMAKVEKVQTQKPHVMKKMAFQSTSVNYVETMKKKFARSKNSRDALLLAKAFYKKGAFKEAEQWSLTANEINANLDESWLLFAKSKAKLGKKQEAINILAKYYKQNKSSKVKALLGQIKTGQI